MPDGTRLLARALDLTKPSITLPHKLELKSKGTPRIGIACFERVGGGTRIGCGVDLDVDRVAVQARPGSLAEENPPDATGGLEMQTSTCATNQPQQQHAAQDRGPKNSLFRILVVLPTAEDGAFGTICRPAPSGEPATSV